MNDKASNKAATDEDLATMLEAFVDRDETVTYRAVARAFGMAPSSMTRSVARRQLIDNAAQRQDRLRTWAGKARKASQHRLLSQLANKEQRIEELEQQVAVLAASHKALILAVGEMGGFKAWKNFFEDYQIPLQDIDFIPKTKY